MSRTEIYHIERKISDDELNSLIRKLEKNTKVLKKLLFIRYRYDGDSVRKLQRE